MHPIEGAIYFSALFGIPGMTYIVMAYAVMAYAVAAYVVMAYVVVAYVVMANIVMALFGVPAAWFLDPVPWWVFRAYVIGLIVGPAFGHVAHDRFEPLMMGMATINGATGMAARTHGHSEPACMRARAHMIVCSLARLLVKAC